MLKPMNVRKIAFFTPQPTHEDQEEKEGSLELGVYGQNCFLFYFLTVHNLQ